MNYTMKYLKTWLLILFQFSIAFSQQYQLETGSIFGEIYDGTTNEPIAGANVLIVGSTLGAATDFEGKFTISRVPIGTYSLRISAIGYVPFIATDVVVTVARPAEFHVPLQESTLEVEAVQVTASYFQKIPDRPLSNLIQTNEEIRRLPGGLEDVVRAISIIPGVAQVQPGRNDLIVRGGAPSENLFVVDNIEIPNINHFGTQGASGGPLCFVNLDFVDRTNFSTGGFGVRYGDKLSSVLSIDLREGRKDRIGGKSTISASQFGQTLEGPIDENGTFLLSARRSYLDFIFRAAGFGFVPEYWDFLGKGHYHISPKDQLTFLAIGALDNVKYFNDTPDQRFNNSRVLGSDQNQFNGGITWRRLLSNGFSTISFGQTYVDYNYLQNDSLLQPLFRNSSYEHETTFRGDVLLHLFKNTELSAGIQAKLIRFATEMMITQQRTSYGDTIRLDVNLKSNAMKAATYIQLSQTLEKLTLNFGSRIDYFDLIENRFVFAPRFSVLYVINPATNINISIGRYYKSPSNIWLIANPSNTNLSFIGNDQIVLGADYMITLDTKVSFEGYVKKYFDYPTSLTRPYLVLANTGAGFGGSEEGFASFGFDPLVNAGSGEARGIELLIQKKLSEIPCYGTVSLSYSESEFRALDGKFRPSSFDQRWIFNLGGGYILNEKWEFSMKFRYATGRPYTPFDLLGNQSASQYNTLRVSANHSLDLRIDRRWSLGSWTLDTYIDIQNIYNRKPVDIPRYNQRTGKVEPNTSIGILPSIGISAEF